MGWAPVALTARKRGDLGNVGGFRRQQKLANELQDCGTRAALFVAGARCALCPAGGEIESSHEE